MSLDVDLIERPAYAYKNTQEPQVLFEANITHNLARMAKAGGFYMAVWRPEEVGIETASQLIPHLESAVKTMKERKGDLEALSPENGWGSYAGFLPWLEKYLNACKESPTASIRVSR